MAMIRESVRVRAPLQMAYNQWARLEDFPRFIHGVRDVRKRDERHLHWKAEIQGKDMEWESEITKQIPGNLIEWKTPAGGPDHGGLIELHSAGGGEVEVSVRIDYTQAGTAASSVSGQVHNALVRYKRLVEARASSARTLDTDNPVSDSRAQESCEDE